MVFSIHLGAHLTDEGRLVSCLEQNRSLLADQAIKVPPPEDYRKTLIQLADLGETDGDVPDSLSEALSQLIGNHATATNTILSDANLLSHRGASVRGSQFYANATERLHALRDAFDGQNVRLFLAIRNPASFLPALLHRMKPERAVRTLRSMSPTELRWSELVERLRKTWPEAELTVWCDEDTPFIWHRILQSVSGHAEDTELTDRFAWFDTIMIDGGTEKLEDYMKRMTPVDEAHRQRIIAAFLDKFCDTAKLDVDVGVTGWDDAQVDLLSTLYEEDVDRIAGMDGLIFIQP